MELARKKKNRKEKCFLGFEKCICFTALQMKHEINVTRELSVTEGGAIV